MNNLYCAHSIFTAKIEFEGFTGLVFLCCAGLLILSIASLALILWKYRKNVLAYLIPLSLSNISFLIFNLYLVYAGARFYQSFSIIRSEPCAVVCAAIFCMAVTFWLWTKIVLKGEKQRKRLWISGVASLVILLLMVIVSSLTSKPFDPGPYLALELSYCMGISAVVSLVLVLCACRKNKRAYFVPFLLFTAANFFFAGSFWISIFHIWLFGWF